MSKSESERPVSGTKEWAKYSENIALGCEHDCIYCYARANALRHKRIPTPEDWPKMKINEKKMAKGFGKRSGTIMFPTSHDITPSVLPEALAFLKKMLEKGNDVLIVSKPHLDCIKAICRNFYNYRDQILFRFTIGSTNNDVLKFWEPGAPTFKERLAALKYAFQEGFRTSVSAEPFLDSTINNLVSMVQDWVTDTIWIGKLNKLKERVTVQWGIQNAHYKDKVLNAQTDEKIKTLYENFKNVEVVRWKDSIKKVIGLDRPTEAGLDV